MSTEPPSPTPSVSCESCGTQYSQLEKDAFAAVREMAPYVKTIAISEILSRTSELIFINLVTLENENYCVELTQRGWRVSSDRLDCMNGDFHKLDMHVAYYESIEQLLDSLSQKYRENFGAALSSKLTELQTEQKQRQQNGEDSHKCQGGAEKRDARDTADETKDNARETEDDAEETENDAEETENDADEAKADAEETEDDARKPEG